LPRISSAIPATQIVVPDEGEFGFSSITPAGGTLTNLTGLGWSRRTGIVWSAVDPDPGSGNYVWDDMDEEVANALLYGYSMFFVIKTGHADGITDDACSALAISSFKGDGESNRLVSCPIKTAYEPEWRNFIRAIIRRYGKGPGGEAYTGLTDAFRLNIQIENEATSKKFWNIDIESDGVLAAQSYIRVLKQAYLAKTEENATNVDIILQGIPTPDKIGTCIWTPDAAGENCQIPRNRRMTRFADEVMKYPQWFDAVDVHFFSYMTFLPRSIQTGMRWLRWAAKRHGWDLSEKKLYCLEWTPAFIKHVGAKDGAVEAFTGSPDGSHAYFPYSSDFNNVPYLDLPVLVDEDGVHQDEDTIPPCYFSGVYSGVSLKTFAVSVRDEDAALTPQQYRWTDDYQGDGINGALTTWSSPQDMDTDAVVLTEGVSIRWDATTGHDAPFGVGTLAHPSGGVTDIETIAYYYDNLDFIESDTTIPIGNRTPKYKVWFDQEEAMDYPKALCEMLVEGITKFSYVKFPNYFPGYSWDARWWKWHGIIRYTGGTQDNPTFYAKNSYWCHNQFVAATAGYTSVSRDSRIAGVTMFRFNFAVAEPVYMCWATPGNTLDDPDHIDGALTITPVAVAFADLFGWTTARVTQFNTVLDGSNNPTYTTTTISGATTYSVGAFTTPLYNIPLIVEKVA